MPLLANNRHQSIRPTGGAWLLPCLWLFAGAFVPDLGADTLRLVNGKTLQGVVIERTNQHVRIRTADGEQTIPDKEVASIELDDAVQAGRPASSPSTDAIEKPDPGDDQPTDADDEAKAIKKIQGNWMRRIRAIRSTYLDSTIARNNAEGRKRIEQIKDPLAVLPLVQTLGNGNLNCRKALIQALARFSEDESTLNLAALGLIERDTGLRDEIFNELVRRKEPRVVAQYREALASDNDALIRNAATALGAMKARPAVPDLIAALTASRRKTIDVPVTRYFSGMRDAFSGVTNVGLGIGRRVRHIPEIGIATAGAFTGVENRRSNESVTMFRTEVLEALKQITGQNHGFDEAAWRRWNQEQSP